jgi:hypothetical protein
VATIQEQNKASIARFNREFIRGHDEAVWDNVNMFGLLQQSKVD